MCGEISSVTKKGINVTDEQSSVLEKEFYRIGDFQLTRTFHKMKFIGFVKEHGDDPFAHKLKPFYL